MPTRPAKPERPVVIVIDDDPAVLNSLKFSLEVEGFAVRTYATASELLVSDELRRSGCLIIDYYLHDMNGLELLQRLREQHISAPAILITTHPSAVLRTRAANAGVPIVEKPLLGNTLIDSVHRAIDRGRPAIV